MQVSVPLAGYFLGSILFPIVIGAFLWINASTISVWIWGKELSKRVKNEKKPNLFQVKKAIIAGLGLYIFVTTLPSWINSFGKIYADWLMASSIPDTSIMTMFQVQDYVRWFALIVQFLISILFIASPARILAFLDKAQRTWDLIT
jgi:ABC-type antimicrobial peptide transport system permease subunit